MVKVSVISISALAVILTGEVAFASPAPAPSPTLYEQSSPQATAVGQALGGSLTTGVQPNLATGTQQVVSTVILDILGAGLQALSALASPDNTINGTTYTEFYSFGKRVFSQDAFVNFNGNVNFSVGLAPAEIRVPLVIYPVGPVVVQIDGGARFQADVQGQLVPNLVIPLSLASIGIDLQAVADGAGFIEGYANLLVVRAGVGGQVDLVDAQANLNTRISFDGSPPYAGIDAMVTFLSGQFYAFLDLFELFGYKRLLDYPLYSWNGYCFDTGGMVCP